VAALVSLDTSARVAYFAPLTPVPTSDVQQFFTIVAHTLAAFSVRYRSGVDVTDYQAPDRTLGIGFGEEDIIVGHTAYLALDATGAW